MENMYMLIIIIAMSMHVRTSDMIATIPMVLIYRVWTGMLANHGVGTRVGSGSGGGHHLRFRNTTLRMGEEGEEKVIGMCCGEIVRKIGCESGC